MTDDRGIFLALELVGVASILVMVGYLFVFAATRPSPRRDEGPILRTSNPPPITEHSDDA